MMKTYKLADNIVVKQRAKTNFGLNMSNGCLYQLNDTSLDIVLFFKEQHKTEEELLEYLLEEYDVSKEEMIDDVKDMLEELLIQEILITG